MRMAMITGLGLSIVQTVVRKVSTKCLTVMKGTAILACTGYFCPDRTFE